MKCKLLFIGLLLILSKISNAQTDFRAGYIITNFNDTLYGEIDYRGDILMGKTCKFKLNENIIEYSPSEIAAYRFIDDGKYFVSKEVDKNNLFLEFLIKGQANIYYFRDNNQNDHYYIEKADMPLSELPYEESVVNMDGKKYNYKSKKHVGLLTLYMQDAPDLRSQIENIKTPEHGTLLNLAKNYHYAVCLDGEDCIIFEKKKPLFKSSMDIVLGAVDYRNDKTNMQGGILFNIWMPRANEKLHLRTGVLLTKASLYENNNYLIWKIPVMIEYIYPKSIIRPKAAYGIGIFLTKDIAPLPCMPAFMGGLNIVVSKSLSFSLEYNIDFSHATMKDVPIPIIPGGVYSQFFLCGLSIKL